MTLHDLVTPDGIVPRWENGFRAWNVLNLLIFYH
jgi:hypothetical protein